MLASNENHLQWFSDLEMMAWSTPRAERPAPRDRRCQRAGEGEDHLGADVAAADHQRQAGEACWPGGAQLCGFGAVSALELAHKSLVYASDSIHCGGARRSDRRDRSGRRGAVLHDAAGSSDQHRSAISTVDSRWAMTTAVRSQDRAQRPLHQALARDVQRRRRLVEDQHGRIGEERPANATSCRCPADRRRRACRRRCRSRRAGGDELVGADGRAAASTSASVASGRPNRMLSATVPANRKFSWVTMTTARRRSLSARSRRSTPSSSHRPTVGS